MGREAKKRFNLKFEPGPKTWTASSGKQEVAHRRPGTALRRLAAQKGLEVGTDEWFEYARFPGDLKERILHTQDILEKYEEVVQQRVALAAELENEYGLNRSELGRLLGLSPARMGVVLDEYYSSLQAKSRG